MVRERSRVQSSLAAPFLPVEIAEVIDTKRSLPVYLSQQDVRKDGDSSLLRITPHAGSVKTGEYRDVPVHEQLVDLGFIDFVDALRDGPLFHNGKADNALKSAKTTSGRISNCYKVSASFLKACSPATGGDTGLRRSAKS